MTRVLTASLLATTLATGLFPRAAEACSCTAPSVSDSFERTDAALIVEITGRTVSGPTVYYEAQVISAYKGCYTAGDPVTFSTSSDSATCGVTSLRSGRSYLLFGYDSGDTISINLCDYNVPARTLSARDRNYLEANAESCATPTCDDLSGVDFGACEMVLGYGVLGSSCATISGCSVPDGVALFPTFRECRTTCGP